MSKIQNIIMSADSYKLSHKAQIFPGTEFIYENMTARSFKHLPKEVRELTGDRAVVFGPQATMRLIHEAFQREFFDVPFEQAMMSFLAQVPFFAGAGYDVSHIKALHDKGFLPIRVKALPEGSLVKAKVPMMTGINTDSNFAWLFPFLETVISNETWKSVNNATIALGYRMLLSQAAKDTVGDDSFVKWQGHDFSARGMSGSADAARQGMSHLTSFLGSDAFGSMPVIVQNYDTDIDSFIAGSVNASEHMTETLAIQVIAQSQGIDILEAEYLQMKRLISEVYPSGVVARVCDSYDYWNVVTNIVPRLKDVILARGNDASGMSKVVIRPDSGDPVDIICGTAIPVNTLTDIERCARFKVAGDTFWCSITKNVNGSWETQYILCTINNNMEIEQDFFGGRDSSLVPAEVKGTVECLWETFGGTITEKGYRLLDSHIGMIYGDAITIKRAKEITSKLASKGFASTNTLLGIGSYTYQMNTRDTLGIALKATYAIVNGVGYDLNKNPKTDDGTKKSAKGLLRVEKVDGEYVLFDEQTPEQEQMGELRTIYEDGKFFNQSSFAEIRSRIDAFVG